VDVCWAGVCVGQVDATTNHLEHITTGRP
jgi:hypothetical protein